ncbi:MAG: DUF5777 family beta-barrel protein [Bacteroidetes bacterium]|nr:DUF5777 family beta-barrel protein [Bacteroidota bacterium]
MKKAISYTSMIRLIRLPLLMLVLALGVNELMAQDSTQATAPVVKKKSYVKNTFDGNFIIDNQTVMVPIKGTFEFDIQHRFGTVEHGWKDLAGLFASANMLLGFSYVPIKDLQVGFGTTNDRMQVNGNLKYALFKQTKNNRMPVSVTLFANSVMDTRAKNSALPIINLQDRMSFFSQLIIARKINESISLQVGPSLSYFNNVEAYYDANKVIQPKTNNAHLAISVAGKFKLTEGLSLIANYDQPITQHPMNNPNPNISLGLDMKTSGHDFQIFVGNYGYILPQNNNVYNQNDFSKSQFLIGFNISRLWNF